MKIIQKFCDVCNKDITNEEKSITGNLYYFDKKIQREARESKDLCKECASEIIDLYKEKTKSELTDITKLEIKGM